MGCTQLTSVGAGGKRADAVEGRGEDWETRSERGGDTKEKKSREGILKERVEICSYGPFVATSLTCVIQGGGSGLGGTIDGRKDGMRQARVKCSCMYLKLCFC